MDAIETDDLSEISAQQADIAVEVRCLVPDLRQVDISLALEARNSRGKQARQPPVFVERISLRKLRPSPALRRDFQGARAMLAGRFAQDPFHEQRRSMVPGLETWRLFIEPPYGSAIKSRDVAALYPRGESIAIASAGGGGKLGRLCSLLWS